MSAQATTRRAGARPGRLASVLAYDGAVATTLLVTFQYFLVSASFIAGIVPAIAFVLLVGWQPTHVAIWLGAISLLTIAPSLYGILAAAQRELVSPGASRAGREFWHSFLFAARALWWLNVAVPLVALLLAYDLAIVGASDLGFLSVVAAALLVVALTVGLCLVSITSGSVRPLALLTTATRSILRRPHVALSWLMLIAVAAGATMIPLVGVPLTLFAPAGAAAAIVICSDALGFTPHLQETRS